MNEALNEHLDAVRHWIEQHSHLPRPEAVLSTDERKQLEAINKAIVQLARDGVPVPKDLRKLKLQLSAKDASGAASDEVEAQILELEAVIEQLRKLLQAARSFRDRLKSTGQTGGTKTHFGVTLLELVQSGHLSTADRLELQWVNDGPRYEGKVQTDGSLMAKTPSGWKHYRSPSMAAGDIAQCSLNGWKHWRRVNTDGSRASLEEIRSRYMREGRSQ